MIRLSIGTAIELGLSNGRSDIAPKTAYIMIGNACNNNCSFCSQSISSSSRKDTLARVSWPEYSKEEIVGALISYNKNNIKRICLQTVSNNKALKCAEDFIIYIKDKVNFPISVSAKVENENDVQRFLDLGVQKIGIAIDGANKKIYESVKGSNFEEKVRFITDLSKEFPGKISTHIIVGLGESHEDICNLYKHLIDNNVTVSLFAFTPVKGTKLQDLEQPSIESYRRVQLMTYLINKGHSKNLLTFKDGYLVDINEVSEYIYKEIMSGIPFEIRGCKDCNRPYYNERPGKTIYNYSKALNETEIDRALKELNMPIKGGQPCNNGGL